MSWARYDDELTLNYKYGRLRALGRDEQGWRIVAFHSFSEPERVPISVDMRRQVIERDGYVCGICGWLVDPSDAHIDHVQPVRHGGRTTLDNLRVTHSRCNLRKGARV